jgi:hypothetical protein
MADPTELALSTGAADALSGTTDPNTGAIYNTIAQASYYTAAYQKEVIWNRIMGLPNELRVVKDGALTYGVMSGRFNDGASSRAYAGSTGNALTDDALNYVYLTGAGTLTCNTTGFPTDENHVPLATILTASGAYAATDIADYRGRAAVRSIGARFNVEAATAGSGSPNVLTGNENGKAITNEGAGAKAYNTLPTAVAGLQFTFVVQDADGLRVTAGAGDTIRIAASACPAAGYVESTTIGDAVTLLAINSTEWVAVSYVGTWTVSS